MDTVHGPGKNLSRTGFASATRSGKEVRMGYLIRIYSFLQSLRNVALTDYIFKGLRPPFTI